MQIVEEPCSMLNTWELHSTVAEKKLLYQCEPATINSMQYQYRYIRPHGPGP